MPRCKKSDCREEAVPFGKRYCPTHMAEYKRKQREYEEVRKTLRNCECCGDTLTKTKHDAGETLCWSCDEKRIEQIEIESALCLKINQLDEASTLDELKTWIKDHLLK